MGGDALMEMQIGAVGEGVGGGVFHQHHGVVCFSCRKKEGGIPGIFNKIRETYGG